MGVRLLLMAAVSAAAIVPAAQAQAVGILTQVKGKVTVASGGKAARPAQLADALVDGAVITTGPDGSATFLYCPRNSSVSLGANSSAKLKGGQLESKGSVNTAAVKYCFAPPASVTRASAQQVGGVNYRTGMDNLRILTPTVNVRVLPSPTFRWTAMNDVEKYVVAVQTRDQKPLWETSGKTTAVEYKGKQPLSPGETYRVRIMAVKGDEELASASMIFRVLPETEAKAVAEKLKYFRDESQRSSAGAAPHLQLALLYEDLGDAPAAARAYEDAARFGASDFIKERLTALRR